MANSIAVIAGRRRRRGTGSLLLVSDTFTRTNATSLGTADTGQAWTADTGTWGTNGTQAYCSTSSGARNIAFVDAGVANVSVKVTLAAWVAGVGVIARCSAGINGFGLAPSGGAGVDLYKVVAGVATPLGSVVYSTSVNDVYEIRCTGNTIEGYINGVLQISATDSFNATATRHGIVNFNDITGRYDGFTVSTL